MVSISITIALHDDIPVIRDLAGRIWHAHYSGIITPDIPEQKTLQSRPGSTTVLTFSQDLAPVVEGNTLLVPLLATASQIGLEVTDGKGQMIYVDSGESTLKLNRETGEARLNGRKLQFTNLIQERKGVVFQHLI